MTPQRRAQQILRLHAVGVNIPDDVLRDARSLLAGTDLSVSPSHRAKRMAARPHLPLRLPVKETTG